MYTDKWGTMRLIGPRHWSCQAAYGADGSGGVAVYPAGQPIPSNWGAGWKLPSSSTVQAVIGNETSACTGCSEGQACPLFASAAKDFLDQIGRPCPATRPVAENVDRLSAGVVAFEDPPGVVGDGLPSGGSYSANGVMTYYPGNPSGSWLETCTLPSDQKDLCTATLNYFAGTYGTR